jgi:hypothetical protein
MAQTTYQDVLIRKIEVSTVEKLKQKAKSRKRSLQAEMKSILQRAAERQDKATRLESIRKLRGSIKNKQQTDSAILLREVRDSR